MKNGSQRYYVNRPRSRYGHKYSKTRHGHRYSKYKKRLSKMMLVCIKQHISNI